MYEIRILPGLRARRQDGDVAMAQSDRVTLPAGQPFRDMPSPKPGRRLRDEP